MSRASVRETLSRHIDQLIAGKDKSARLVAEHPEERAELEMLFDIVRRLRRFLVSVEPSPDYRRDLGMRLVAAAVARANDRAAENRPVGFPVARRRELIWGAAALGSLVSVAAAVVVTQRARSQSRSRRAA